MDELILGFEQFGLRNLKEEMQTILSDQSKLKEEMKKNLSDQSKINERIKKLFTHIQCHNMFFNDNYFPLDNDDDLNYIENKISKKIAAGDEFKSLLVDELLLIGGNDINDMVKRLMTKLFTMKILSGYSRAGGCKSRKFSELKIYEVIFDTIVKQFSDTTTTQKMFNEAIDLHLKKAPKRSV